MESSELLQCKKYLRSTLIANKGGIRVSDLSRQYYQSVGEHIPYADFGFKTLESFLISVPDVCQLNMNGQKLMATVVTSTATAHIARMIGAQKGSKSSSKKGSGGVEPKSKAIKKKKKTSTAKGKVHLKNAISKAPVQMLNALVGSENAKFVVTSQLVAEVTINGQTFKGIGKSKDIAKNVAAEAAINYINDTTVQSSNQHREEFGFNVQDYTNDEDPSSFGKY